MSNPLPVGWALSSLGDLVAYKKGKKPETLLEGKKPGYIPYLDIRAIEKKEVRQYADSSSSHLATKDDLLVVWDGARSGWVGTGISGAIGSTIMALRPRQVNRGYIQQFIASKFKTINTNTKGTGIPHVDPEVFWNLDIPLPPLPEQERIVAKLEELLSKVDVCQKRLEKMPVILKRFRQSVLAAACSGRLTANWREGNPKIEPARELLKEHSNEPKHRQRKAGRLWGAGEVPELTEDERDSLPETWVWTKTSALGDEPTETVQVGPMSMQSRDFASVGIPVLNVGCVQSGWFDLSKLDYMPRKKAAQFSRYRIAANDILFTRSGTVGRCALATRAQNEWLMTFHLLRVRVQPIKCLPEYLLYVFQGAPHILRQTTGAAIGSTRAGFNTRLLAELDVPLPPMLEQHEILRQVRALYAVADQIEARYNKARSHVDKLTQSILAKAFRGELVPQDPNDEPASVLLERIRNEREIQAGCAEPKSRPPKRAKKMARNYVVSKSNAHRHKKRR